MNDNKKNTPKIPRQEMPKQAPEVRRHNFVEVASGYTEKEALLEASRCIQCKKMPCTLGCPVMVDIPQFIEKIVEKDYEGAIRKIKEKNSFPAVCGRVCPQEDQCEKKCTLGIKGEAVAIGRLERFVADIELKKTTPSCANIPKKTGKKVGVVGSGPAGLTLAGDLVKLGHSVSVFEALHKAGGVMVYGIPEFRLPKSIVQAEIDAITKMGVELNTNFLIGRTRTVDELLGEDGFDAVFLANGAGLPFFLDIPGENMNGVYSANEFLTRANLMKAYLFPKVDTPVFIRKRVAVIGGGNVAMDSARTALRLGAEEVNIVYRRSREELPAREEEIENAEEEGVMLNLLLSPLEVKGEDGWVKSLVCQKMELGEPDERGRRRPLPIDGELSELEVDMVIIAVGQGANPLVSSTTSSLEINRWGYIKVKDESGLTSRKGVYAGGDIVTGAATVILAMGAGKKTAHAIHEYLTGAEYTK